MSDVDEYCPSPDVRLEKVDDLEVGRFRVGDRVIVRATPTEPTDNPRTPSYSVGCTGTVIAVHGVIVNPIDHHLAYPPMYSVRFAASDLFGTEATHTVVSEVHEEWLDADEHVGV
jgi:hypothetical protein